MSHPYTSPEASFSTGQVDECVNLPLNRVCMLPILARYARMLVKHKDFISKKFSNE